MTKLTPAAASYRLNLYTRTNDDGIANDDGIVLPQKVIEAVKVLEAERIKIRSTLRQIQEVLAALPTDKKQWTGAHISAYTIAAIAIDTLAMNAYNIGEWEI